ncbi:hypothetical protein GGR57DRAFT_510999 [Xylariaceae sp. FL1272]|nr:hypothetical protein GGR57DRAFT_510999 [Xylariaceae sp. FL1272]
MISVSLSGPDNVGKTTQLNLLPSSFTVKKVGSLHENDERMGEMHRQQRLQAWWWGSSPQEFVATIFSALANRADISATKNKADIIIFDRGVRMFEAVAVAMIAIKNGHDDLDTARQTLKGILGKYDCRLPSEDVTILLKHGKTLEESVQITMSRGYNPNDKRYSLYQRLLQSELQNQELSGVYQHIIHVSSEDSIVCIQDRIRRVLSTKTSNSLFQPVLHNLTAVYAFGGLSECGKSTIAEALCANFGSKQAFRAKIIYFNGIAKKEQALHLFHALERFQGSHYWLKLITIESLHNDLVTRHLKEWIGDKLQIIFIDTHDHERQRRSLVPMERLTRKDRTKTERGAVRIRSYADLTLDNNGPLTETLSVLMSFCEAKGEKARHEQ